MSLLSDTSIRILIIEDSPGDAFLLQHMIAEFEDLTAQTMVVGTVADAERRLALENFSLIFCDLNLPDSNGLETVKRILANDQELPVIVLTGNDARRAAVEAIRLGAQDFLEKTDITSNALERMVTHSLERQSLRCELQDSLLELEAANRRFVNLLSDLTDAVVVVDLNGSILYVNPAAEGLFQQNAGALVGSAFGLSVDSGDPIEVELLKCDGNERTMELRVVETEWDGQPARLASLRDITHRKRIEQAMHMAQKEAETANEMKSRFLANMSHELRTPLNSIIGFSEIIKDETLGAVGNAQYRGYAGDILQSGHHLLSLINDLLDLSKAESGHYEIVESEFDMVEIMRDSVRLVAPQVAAKHHELVSDLALEACRFRGGKREILQILVNLLSNAIKFTPDGGRIDLRMRPGSMGALVIEVEDTGVGIEADEVPRVFDAYSQVGEPYLRNTVEGTGLGLALCQRLVEMHGGFVKLHSEVGEGTRVSVTLPRDRVLDKATEMLKIVCN